LPPAILPPALLPPLPWFDSIDDSFSYSTLRDLWATHYSRAIENQLDSVHVPFVHKTTIGRGNRTLINGPLTHVESQPYGDVINMWVFNEVDTGQKPRRASELPAPPAIRCSSSSFPISGRIGLPMTCALSWLLCRLTPRTP